MNNDNNGSKISDIKPLMTSQQAAADEVHKTTFGGSQVQTDPDVKNVLATLNGMFKQNNENTNGDFMQAMEDVVKNMNDRERNAFKKIKESLTDGSNINILHNLYSNLNSNIAKYEDLKIVAKIVPQMNDAVKSIRDSILSPDDFTKQVSTILSQNGTPLKEDDGFSKQVESILKKYEYDKLNKKIVESTLVNGRAYVAVIPYKSAFEKMLNSKEMKKMRTFQKGLLTESVNSEKEKQALISQLYNETFSDMDANIKNLFENKNVGESLISSIDNIEISEGVESLELSHVLLEAANAKGNIDDKFTKTVKSVLPINSDGLLDHTKQGKNINTTNKSISYASSDIQLDKVKGCIVKELDIKNVIPIQIHDVCLGYYYIENNRSLDVVKNATNNNAFRFKAGDNYQANDTVDNIYKKLSDLLVVRLDKRFVESNPELRQGVYEVLKYSDFLNNQNLKITYLKPSEVIEYEIDDGTSVLDNVLFFAKLYLGLLLSSIMMKISRSNDIRAYYLKTGLAPDITELANNAIQELKKDQKGLMHLNNVPKLISTFTKFSDLFIPTTTNGEKPIEFDVIAGQDITIKDELLEMLEEIITSGIGVPSVLINASNDVDFARTMTMLNSKYLRRIISFQIDLNPSNTKLARAILVTEIDDEDMLKKVNTLEATYQSPVQMALNTLLEKINNAKDLATAIAQVMLGDSNEDAKLYDALLFELVKANTPDVPWAKYEGILKQIKLKLKQDVVVEGNADGEGDVM